MIVPYNPQQNEVTEGKSKIIEEHVKEMMHDQDFPMFLWSEVSMPTFYMKNIIPYIILEDMALEKAFMGHKPKVGHLRIFGCPIYIHVPKDKRKK